MYVIPSAIASQEYGYVKAKNLLSDYGFGLGGNWDYKNGSFDCALDGVNKVWLRIPFDVTTGELDSDSTDESTRIKLGQPYVLKHIYNEGLDKEAHPMTLGAFIDQFADPVDADADIEGKWIRVAEELMSRVEPLLLS